MSSPQSTPEPQPFLVRRGSGVPLVFIQGNAVDHRMQLGLDDIFDHSQHHNKAQSWERFHLDLPGFGQTPRLPEPGGLPELADWLTGTVKSLVGTKRFALVGTSLGGLLARHVAATVGDQCVGLALLAPVVDPVRAKRTLPDHQLLQPDPALLATLSPDDAATFSELSVIQSPDSWALFQRDVLPGLRASDPQAMANLEANYALPSSPDPALSGAPFPVLIVTGRQDAVVGYEDQARLAQQFPHSTYAVLDRAGHNLHTEQPAILRALLTDWAQAVQRYSGIS